MAPYPIRGRAAQHGATLVVGLVLLLVLTVLGVSGMNTATMQITMAANAQFQEDAFQQTEDAIDIVLGTRDYSTDTTHTLDWTADPDYNRKALTNYRWNTPVPAGRAFSLGEFDAFHFDVQSIGRGPRNATSQITQSFYVVGRAL
ncbi:MAG: PilX N-terminal domain-containing pilus assembly protein [Gammaproteobacteria bacterium]